MRIALADPNVHVGGIWLQLMHRYADVLVDLFRDIKRAVSKPFIVCWIEAPEEARMALMADGISSGPDFGDARQDDTLGRMVAVVEGHAVAGGFTLAMGFDFVIAKRGAIFGALEMRGGFLGHGQHRNPDAPDGPRVALEYFLAAETFPAKHRFENRPVPTARWSCCASLTALDPWL